MPRRTMRHTTNTSLRGLWIMQKVNYLIERGFFDYDSRRNDPHSHASVFQHEIGKTRRRARDLLDAVQVGVALTRSKMVLTDIVESRADIVWRYLNWPVSFAAAVMPWINMCPQFYDYEYGAKIRHV